MNATDLSAELVAAGLTVVEEPGWKTRGGTWAESKPVGVMQHHTAPPNPFPIRALYADNKIKANIGTHEDGTVYLIAYRACNYSSGKGSNRVLTQNVRPGNPPTQNAKARNLTDDKGGNRYFWNFENSHPGNGSPMPAVQSDAIAVASSVVNNHFGLSENNMISHAEWTGRKGDPYWDGSRRIIEKIRSDTAGVEDMPTAEEIAQKVWEFPGGSGVRSVHLVLDRIYRNVNELTIAHRTGNLGADISDEDISEIVDAIQGAGVADAVADELARRLVE